MSIVRVNGASWAVGDKLTSGQVNQLDLNGTYALDKRAGQADTLESVVSCAGAGRVIGTYAGGADADTTYLVTGANAIVDAATLSANRIYTLSNAGAVAGDRITVLNRSGFYITVKDGAATTLIVLGAQMDSDGESVWADLLFNGTAWVLFKSSRRPTLGGQTFTSPGTYTTARGITRLLLIGYGGGGGGAGGLTGTTAPSQSGPGGGGGGGSRTGVRLVSVAESTGYAVTPGIPGTAGPANAVGGDGGDTTFASLATFIGGGGGQLQPTVSGGTLVSHGGATARSIGLQLSLTTSGSNREPGAGGLGANQSVSAIAGNPSVESYAGGLAGSLGAVNSTAYGGGGGGGGGGGPGGPGGAGGAGGGGGSIGSGGAGGAGSAAAANTGAGGGAGGAGGQCTAGGAFVPGAGGVGAAGGSGKLTVIPIR